jgi:hypothetical protein
MLNKKLILVSAVMVSFVPVLALAAAGLIPCDGPQGVTGITCTFNSLVGSGGLLSKVINFLLFNLLTPLATIAILWSGLRMLFNPESTKIKEEGKRIMKTVVYGMVIAFSAYLIVQAIVNGLASNSTPGSAAKNYFNTTSNPANK